MRFDKIHDQDFLITVPTAKKCAFWKQQNELLAKNYLYTEVHAQRNGILLPKLF